ncbi:hypothetical protein WJX84_008394 [Apatococcus fuscideae]|uniref:Sugar phosphate transporter domain-containing protein n=1 Tax=Apatococcus fuscideae TaxID=2026836 RepID=A0AAW1T3S9_9CHLO
MAAQALPGCLSTPRSTSPITHAVQTRLRRSSLFLRRQEASAAASVQSFGCSDPAEVWRQTGFSSSVRQHSRSDRQQRRSTLCQASPRDNEKLPLGDTPKESLNRTLLLGVLFSGWYLFNIYFNIYNKQSLTAFPFPYTITTLQFALGGAFSIIMWTFGLLKRPQIDADLIKGVLPLAVVHTLGNLLTNISLGKVAVSFTHTIKAMEPFFSVLLSSIFLNDRPTLLIMFSLFPIVVGVGLASVSEVTFNWPGFAAAMGSNVTFQSRNVFSKKLMGGSSPTSKLGNINLFSLITVMSFFLLAPVTLLTEGVKFTPSAMRAVSAVAPEVLIKRGLLAAACFHAYQQVSYMILARVTPVTHSIGNCLKRVIVIVASVIFFQNPMSRQNMLGTAIALGGVFLYSQAKRSPGAKIKAA